MRVAGDEKWTNLAKVSQISEVTVTSVTVTFRSSLKWLNGEGAVRISKERVVTCF